MRICEPYNGEELQWHPVTPSMGKASFQGPECCKPLKRKNIAAFFKPKAALGWRLCATTAVPSVCSCKPLHQLMDDALALGGVSQWPVMQRVASRGKL